MKATFTAVELTPVTCGVCGREFDDPYRLNLGDREWHICDECAPNVKAILEAGGVEVEYPTQPSYQPTPRAGWHI